MLDNRAVGHEAGGMGHRRPLISLLSVSLAAAGAALVGSPPVGAEPAAEAVAPGAPGSLSHFDLARKDCLGTARNTTSKVWYTVADGVLSDVYSPTIDNTNVETLQYVVTDGRTFTDLQSRDMTYTVRATDPSGMACRVTSTAKSGGVPAGHRLRHRPGARRRGHVDPAGAGGAPVAEALRPVRRDGQRQRRRRAGQRWRRRRRRRPGHHRARQLGRRTP